MSHTPLSCNTHFFGRRFCLPLSSPLSSCADSALLSPLFMFTFPFRLRYKPLQGPPHFACRIVRQLPGSCRISCTTSAFVCRAFQHCCLCLCCAAASFKVVAVAVVQMLPPQRLRQRPLAASQNAASPQEPTRSPFDIPQTMCQHYGFDGPK